MADKRSEGIRRAEHLVCSPPGAMRRMTGDLCDPWEGEDGMTSEEAILGGFLPHRDGPLLRNKLSTGHARNPHPRK